MISRTRRFKIAADSRRRLHLIALAAALISSLGARVGWAQFEDQPDAKHSTLPTHDGGAIKDSEFADLLEDLLFDGSGDSNVADAKFFFNQCYGGGFLDDVQHAMSNKVKWVGGAASKHNETVIGQVSEAENIAQGPGGGEKRYSEIWEGDPPLSFWGQSLINNLGDNTETIKKNLEDARAADETGPNQGGATGMLRTPQVGFGNGGENIKLNDPAVTSHHAILFAGDPDAERHFNTLKGVYDQLKATWGDPATNANVGITVLFGDGMKNSKGEDLPAEWNAMAATKANLEAAMNAIKPLLNENEQFLFYGYDHGGTATDVVGGGSANPGGTCDDQDTCTANFQLYPGELEGMFETLTNVPQLTFDYLFPGITTGNVDVLFNGSLIGQLDPFVGTTTLTVPEELVLIPTAFHTVELINNSGSSFDWLFSEFQTGGINDTPLSAVVPEPETLGLIAVACVACTCRRRRKFR